MTSPYGIYLEHARRGQLAYQRDGAGRAVFYPRHIDLDSAEAPQWAVSTGLGQVHASTTLYERDGNMRNVSLIDLDEGFRMMSRVEGIPPHAVTIGLRVAVDFVIHDDAPLAIFRPVELQP